MVTSNKFIELALSFEGAEELPHFEKLSYRFNKRIFATLNVAERIACLKLNPELQNHFCAPDSEQVYPVPNKWGHQGWTFVALDRVAETYLVEILTVAFKLISKKK